MRGAVTVVSGAGVVSKSSLMISYSIALAFGVQWHRFRPVSPARVLIYNVEDDDKEQRRRFSGALRSTGKRPADLRGRVRRIGPKMVGTLLTMNTDTKALEYTPAMEELINSIEQFRPDVLILDPLVELHGGEENDNGALRNIMATFRTLAIKYDLAIVILHHTRKGANLAGDPDAVRGASSIIGAARIVLTVTAMTDDEAGKLNISPDARKHYFRVDGAKSNYALLTDAEWFQRVSVQLDNGDWVAVPEPWTPPIDVVTDLTKRDVETAVAAGSPDGPWSPLLGAHARSVKHIFEKHGIVTDAGQKAMKQHLKIAGFEVVKFKKPNRDEADGYRSPDGKPDDARWVEV
jgi:hypothetical protein